MIHQTAIVSSDATIGSNIRVGPFAVIEAGAEIGNDCIIGARAHIKTWTRIGSGNIILEGAVLGGAPQHTAYQGEETWLIIGDGNRIGEFATLHRGTSETGKTVIGNRNYIMGYAHIGHDCRVGNHCILTNYAGLAGHCALEDRVILGAYAGLHQFVRVGEMAMVAAGAKLGKDLVPYIIAQGYPATPKSVNMVGLDRNGVDEKGRTLIRKIFKIMFRSGRSVPEALDEIKNLGDDPRAHHFIEFVNESKRGICR